MAGALRRIDLQASAQGKIDDAELLLRNGRYSNAYCICGYAVELGLKACISRQISADTIPDKNLIRDIFVHDFKKLVNLAGLAGALNLAEAADPDFAANVAIVAEWSPDARYESHDSFSASYLISAINDPSKGVLQWIKQYW